MTSPEQIEGYDLGESLSDGEVTCTGCWDNCEHDTSVDTRIPEGEPVYFTGGMTDCGMEWDAYCASCARQRLADLETEAQLIDGLNTLTNR